MSRELIKSPAVDAINIIKKDNLAVETEWLELVHDDYIDGHISLEDCYRLAHGFMRGLIATGVGSEVLDDFNADNYFPF